jgi:hypothetical protein
MTLNWFIVKASDSTRVHRINALMKMRLRRCLCICIALLLVSCASAPPQETYLTSSSLSSIKKVAILASANAPDVNYASTGQPLLPIHLGSILLQAIDAAARSGMDTEHAQQIGKRVDLTNIEDRIVEVFTKSISATRCFQTVDHIKSKKQDEQLLSNSGYDAIIRLTVKEISLGRIAGDYVGLHIHVQGQLKCLKSEKILWDREEMIKSPEFHSLDYYKENGLRELDAILEKAGQKLAYDFIYLK